MDQIVERAESARETGAESIEQVLDLNDKGRPRFRFTRWLSAAVVLAAVGGLAWWQFGASQQQQTVFYRTVDAQRGPITVEVSATGTLEPLTQVEVSSELSGIVRAVAVEENQRVAKGDVLAELDTVRILAQIERAEANVAAARAKLMDAQVTVRETERTLARTRQLKARGNATDQSVETAEAAYDRAVSAVASAEASLAVAEADLKLQQADLAKSTIYAPIDGTVLSRSVNPGQTVASSMQAPVLFVIAENLERMELKAAVDEADIGAVQAGQNARFTVDAFPDRTFNATIRDVSYASTVTDGVVTYQARLDVDNRELLLRPGMTATVEIVTREDDGVLLIPSAAFRFSPPQETACQSSWSIQQLFMPRPPMRQQRGQGTRGSVGEGRPLYVLRDGKPEQVRVVTGATDGEKTEILSGLEEGDRVIIGTGAGPQRAGRGNGEGRGPGSGPGETAGPSNNARSDAPPPPPPGE